MRDSDTILMEEAYIQMQEGFWDRAKAKFAGAKQTATNVGQQGKKLAGKGQAVAGSVLNNANMQQAGAAKIQTATEYQQTSDGNVDQSKIKSLTNGYTSKLDSALQNITNQLIKIFKVNDQETATAKLTETDPNLGELYTNVTALIEKVKGLGQ